MAEIVPPPAWRELKVHPVLSSLIQPVQVWQYSQLEQDLLQYGCREPLLTWNGYIVDGHKRWQICREKNIPFDTAKAPFSCLPEAVSFLCETQLKRDYLPEGKRKYLVGKWYEAQRELSFRDEKAGMFSGQPIRAVTACRMRAERIASCLGLSLGAVRKYNEFQKAVDIIAEMAPELGHRIISGGIRISHKNTLLLGSCSADTAGKLEETVIQDNIAYLCEADILHAGNPGLMHQNTRKSRRRKPRRRSKTCRNTTRTRKFRPWHLLSLPGAAPSEGPCTRQTCRK